MLPIPRSGIVSFALASALALMPASYLSAQTVADVEETEFRTCSQSMEITDVRFSARASIGVEVQFDDIGCAIIWRNLQCALDQATFDSKAKARDFNNLSSILMSKAYYVLDGKLQSPIGFGLAAFRDLKSAKAFIRAKGSGKLMSYKEVIRLDLRPPEPPEEDQDKIK